MGLLSSLAYGVSSGLFDVLKSQLYANKMADKAYTGDVLKSLITSLEGQDPGSPGALETAKKIEEISGVKWPTVQDQMPTPTPVISPTLGALAQASPAGREGVSFPGALPTLSETPPMIPTREALAALPPISPEKLMSRAVQSGDQETIDRLMGARGVTQKLAQGAEAEARKRQELEYKQTYLEHKAELDKTKSEAMMLHKDISNAIAQGRLDEATRKNAELESLWKTKLTQQEQQFKEKEKRLTEGQYSQNFRELDAAIHQKAEPRLIQSIIDRINSSAGYEMVKPKVGWSLWGTPPIVGYDTFKNPAETAAPPPGATPHKDAISSFKAARDRIMQLPGPQQAQQLQELHRRAKAAGLNPEMIK